MPPATGPAPWVTPDAVALDLATATVGSRGVAYLIDLAILLAGLLVIALAELILGVTGFVPGWFGLALLLLFGFTLQFGYPIGFEVLMRGRTPGKAAMGLRVVTVEGLPVGFRHATIRAVIGLFELLGTFGLIAVVSSLANARGQRLGDLAAGTIVLRERRSGGPPSAMTFMPPRGWEGYVARLDVSGLGSQERAAVRDTLRRIDDLPADVRERIVGELAETLAPRVSPAPPEGMTAEVWLRSAAAAVQRGTAEAQRRVGSGPVGRAGGASSLPPPVPERRLAHGGGQVSADPGRSGPTGGSGQQPTDGQAGTGGFAPPG
jgi:uncharacterized RDD family membrane protein YckC